MRSHILGDVQIMFSGTSVIFVVVVIVICLFVSGPCCRKVIVHLFASFLFVAEYPPENPSANPMPIMYYSIFDLDKCTYNGCYDGQA